MAFAKPSEPPPSLIAADLVQRGIAACPRRELRGAVLSGAKELGQNLCRPLATLLRQAFESFGVLASDAHEEPQRCVWVAFVSLNHVGFERRQVGVEVPRLRI